MKKRFPHMRIGPGDALVVVDVQRDFLPGGALAVPEGDRVVRPLNDYIAAFVDRGLPVCLTRDWHPAGHCSFTEQGGPWPPHCVRNTQGVLFADDLLRPFGAMVISKAEHADRDAYSGFDGTGLAERLHKKGVTRLFIGGLATDYCVKFTVLDALKHGFAVVLLTDAVRAVNVRPGDGEAAIAEMLNAGAVPVSPNERAA